ncbi:MAG: class I SAM-dependent methyltransferase family protein [Candidatus Marsarchaeota archaeon]|nr:class I SAM-dependent methyltransferase family protein [Candidatus Marsarchaeota archaeon]MCL5413546.1 class I SAM-dependent methyltransferase family protein [Candidatus Marsarchaeota archaeon]
MRCVKTLRSNAEKVRKYLARHKLMVNNYRIISADEFIYFPISGTDAGLRAFLSRHNAGIVNRNSKEIPRKPTYREKLMEQLGEEYGNAIKGYDIIGDIATIESKNRKNALKVARAVASINKNVKTVIRKTGPVSGRYRIRKYEYVWGKRKYDTIYRENGAVFNIDVRKSFFSPRLAYERGRINGIVGKGEKVMVMFAGVGPFAIEIAKCHKDAEVVAVELNKQAYRYMIRNIGLNKTKNVDAVLGDVKEVSKSYRHFADRIIMPLPKDSFEFLDSVLKVAKRRCIVHYYAFGRKDTAFKEHIGRLRNFFKSHGRKFKVIFKRIVRPYSPKDIEIVVDFVIMKSP